MKGNNFKAIQVHNVNIWCFYLSATATTDDSNVAQIGTLPLKFSMLL